MKRIWPGFIVLVAIFLACGAQTQPSVGLPPASTVVAERATSPPPAGRETIRPSACESRRPLPFLSHWTSRRRGNPDSTTPSWQLDWIHAGHHWQLVLPLRHHDDAWDEWAEQYYGPALYAASEQGLEFAMLFTQWEELLYRFEEKAPVPGASGAMAGRIESPKGKPLLSPFGDVEAWRAVGRLWARSPILQEMQSRYPDPPVVYFVSNNESDRLRWFQSKRVRDASGPSKKVDFEQTRRDFGDGYIKRYSAMIEGIREGLGPWRSRVRFVTWGGANAFMGRTKKRSNRSSWIHGGQPLFGLTVPGRLSIFPEIWDGASPRYYITHMRGEDDRSVFGPQSSGMYLPLHLEDACAVDSDFYWELSTWVDPEYRKSEQRKGRTYGVDRYVGLVKIGTWLARPQAVRLFNYGARHRAQFEEELVAVQEMIDVIHASPVLRRFYEQSELVPNPDRSHPHRLDLPVRLASAPPWFALETQPGPSGDWSPTSEMPVWAIARIRGQAPEREWMVLVQSPEEDRDGVRIDLPGFGSFCGRASRAGLYYLVEEREGRVRSLEPMGGELRRLPGCPSIASTR